MAVTSELWRKPVQPALKTVVCILRLYRVFRLVPFAWADVVKISIFRSLLARSRKHRDLSN